MSGRVLYIAGYGRSGSSVLSRMLGHYPGFLSVGEFWRILSEIEKGGMCSCARRIVDCELWSSVLLDHNGVPSKSEIEIMRALFDRPGIRCVIDSTKTAYSSCVRPLIYLKNDFDLVVLHLTRSLGGVVESAKKGRNRDLESGIRRERRFETLRTTIGWAFANMAAQVYGFLFPQRYIHVRYEDLIDRPAFVLRNIGEFLEVDLGELGEYFDAGKSFRSGHEVAGNRTLRSGEKYLRRENGLSED